jgi:hypothetical protein
LPSPGGLDTSDDKVIDAEEKDEYVEGPEKETSAVIAPEQVVDANEEEAEETTPGKATSGLSEDERAASEEDERAASEEDERAASEEDKRAASEEDKRAASEEDETAASEEDERVASEEERAGSDEDERAASEEDERAASEEDEEAGLQERDEDLRSDTKESEAAMESDLGAVTQQIDAVPPDKSEVSTKEGFEQAESPMPEAGDGKAGKRRQVPELLPISAEGPSCPISLGKLGPRIPGPR